MLILFWMEVPTNNVYTSEYEVYWGATRLHVQMMRKETNGELFSTTSYGGFCIVSEEEGHHFQDPWEKARGVMDYLFPCKKESLKMELRFI